MEVELVVSDVVEVCYRLVIVLECAAVEALASVGLGDLVFVPVGLGLNR